MGGAPLVLAHVYHMNDATFLLTLGSSWSIEVDQFISRLRIVGLVWNLVCEFYGKWFAILCNMKTALERLVFWLPSTWLSHDIHAGIKNELITPIKESKWAAKRNVSRRYWEKIFVVIQQLVFSNRDPLIMRSSPIYHNTSNKNHTAKRWRRCYKWSIST